MQPGHLRAQVVAAVAAARRTDRDAVLRVCADLRAAGEDAEHLLQDLEGQVAEAISRPDWFTRWGRHYLPSLERAHALQQCNNFKDPGLQVYGGEAFKVLRDEADAIFLKLPAPKPTSQARAAPSSNFRSTFTRAAPSQPVDMSRYLDRCGGCFASGRVLLADGSRKPIEEVVAGDRVKVGDGEDEVACVVAMRFPAGVRCPTVDLGDGVVVTPWHPVRVAAGAWTFPARLGETVARDVDAVYSLLLRRGGAFTIGAVDAVALGHGYTGEVASHAFFGSRAAVERALAPMRGFAAGRVVLRADCLERSRVDGRVCGYRAAAEITRPHAHRAELLLEAQLEALAATQAQRHRDLARAGDDADALARLHAEWAADLGEEVCA